MSVFQFTKSQRVIIPAAMAGAENVQGLVAEGHAELDAEPRYILQWPNAEKIEPDGLFGRLVGEVGQGELIKAQPPAMIPVAQADERAKQAHEHGRRLERNFMAMERDLRVTARLRSKRKASRKASARKRTRK